MSYFQPREGHNMLALMLNPQYKGLGLVIQYVNKQKAFHIANEMYYSHYFFMHTRS
jgi:hypothetical protein